MELLEHIFNRKLCGHHEQKSQFHISTKMKWRKKEILKRYNLFPTNYVLIMLLCHKSAHNLIL